MLARVNKLQTNKLFVHSDFKGNLKPQDNRACCLTILFFGKININKACRVFTIEKITKDLKKGE